MAGYEITFLLISYLNFKCGIFLAVASFPEKKILHLLVFTGLNESNKVDIF
jgi:hypothetical protein